MTDEEAALLGLLFRVTGGSDDETETDGQWVEVGELSDLLEVVERLSGSSPEFGLELVSLDVDDREREEVWLQTEI